MKKALFLFAIVIVATLTSCESLKERTVEIKTENDDHYTAIIAPIMFDDMPTIGENISIMNSKPVTGHDFIYNGSWSKSDTSAMWGLIKREIITGTVVAVSK